MTFLVVMVLLAIGAGVVKVLTMTPEERDKMETRQQERRSARPGGQRISEVGRQEGGGLACPKCGGSQFKARRSTAARAGIVATGVVGAAVTRQKQVTCVTCGARYARG